MLDVHRVVSCSDDKTGRVWDIETGKGGCMESIGSGSEGVVEGADYFTMNAHVRL
jgi:WD40 repeat protein